jgi:predicted small lipoprotein YifL
MQFRCKNDTGMSLLKLIIEIQYKNRRLFLMKKTIAVILLIACLSTMLAACGPKDSQGASPSDAPQSSTQKVQKPPNHDDNAPLTEDELTNPNIKG